MDYTGMAFIIAGWVVQIIIIIHLELRKRGKKMNDYKDILRILGHYKEPDPIEEMLKRLAFNPTFNSYEPDEPLYEIISSEPVRPTIMDPLGELSIEGLPMNKKDCWWVKYPKRALQEIKRMESSTNAAFRCSGKVLIWEEVITNNFGNKFYIEIETEDYPHKMPKTYVREAEIKFKRGKHMYNDGNLCLMRSSDYDSSTSVLQIRNLACAWCFAVEVYTRTGEWPTAEAD